MFTVPQSTAWNAPLQAYLSSDHVSNATGKTIAITISKNGGAYANPSGGATNATEIANGSYYVGLTTTDTNTLGPLFIRGSVATVDDVILIVNVVKATNGGLTALPDTAVTTNASLLTSGTGTDQLSVASGRIDAGKILGTAISTPATAGILDVNVKNMNNVAATSITAINANQGTTQPLNFTGTAGSALVKSDMVDIAGAAVSASAAQIGANVVQVNAQTATAAAGVTFPSSIASPTNITAGTITTVTNLTNAPTAGDFTATMKTSIGTAVAASAVASVTGNVGGNVTGSVGSVTSAVTVGTINSSASNIKKNTALAKFEFLMKDSTNHNPATGKTVTATRSLDGGAFGACANAVTELSNGIYYIDLAAGDLNGNVVTFRFTATACDDTFVTIVTQV